MMLMSAGLPFQILYLIMDFQERYPFMELFVKDLVITCDVQDKTSTTLVPSLQKGTQPLELHVQALLTVKTFTNSLWRSYYGNWEFLLHCWQSNDGFFSDMAIQA